MKFPTFMIDNDLYYQFLDKLEEENLTVKQFVIEAITRFITPKQNPTLSSSITNQVHPADYIITELALQLIEKTLSKALPNNYVDNNVSDYPVINDLCLILLPLVDCAQAKCLVSDYNQDDAIMLLKKHLY